MTKLRAGEWTAVAGIGCTIAALILPWYESPAGNLDFWDTFGGAAVLMLAALAAACAMVLAAALERESPALPVSTGVWSVLLGLIGAIAAIVRVLERPDHATRSVRGRLVRPRGRAADPGRVVARDPRRTPVALPPGPIEPRPRP